MTMEKDVSRILTEQEKAFCELLVNGCSPYAGNVALCYEEVFQVKSNTVKGQAKKLLTDPRIQAYVEELEGMRYEENKLLKNRLTENLLHIVEETSKAQYYDRRGTLLSPAPLRSVAVQATKALMEMHPLKVAQVNRLNIEGAGEGGVIFNVVVPTKPEGEEK